MPALYSWSRLGIGRGTGGGAEVFPLAADAGGKFLRSAGGTPFPILGRTSWALIGRTEAEYQAYIDDCVSRGFNTIELSIPHHWPYKYKAPFANDGALLPFTKRLDGSTWTAAQWNWGTQTFTAYTTATNEAPDFTQPDETYWSFSDGLIDYAASKGVLCLVFPCYMGFQGGSQGWAVEMVANGTTKMQTYGTWIGTRWKNKPNIVWMIAGDFGSTPDLFDVNQAAALDAFVTGLSGVTGKASNLYSSEKGSNSTSLSGGSTSDSVINLNGGYSWDGNVSSWCRTAYTEAVGPAYLLEEPYDEEGPDGNNFNPNATQPVRRFQWFGWLSSIGGFVAGNGYVHRFVDYLGHLNTTGTQDNARLAAFIKSIEWWRLIPSGLGGTGTIVTSGGGTTDTDSYVAAACTSLGDLLVAYLGPSSGAPVIDMTRLRGTTTAARWFDPTNGTYTTVSGGPNFVNTGTRTFTKPGTNSAGANDWVLRLDA